MKKALLSSGLFFLVGNLAIQAQDAKPATGGPELTFEKTVHDFGQMKQHGDASTEFKFTNTGNEPLIISNAKGSCGCTVPNWPKEPIKPGESNVVKVKYDSKRVGPINKSVTITSNASNAPTKVIRIKGNIAAAPKEDSQTTPTKTPVPGAPVNN